MWQEYSTNQTTSRCTNKWMCIVSLFQLHFGKCKKKQNNEMVVFLYYGFRELCEVAVNYAEVHSQSAGLCCSPGTFQRRRYRCWGPPWSRGKQRQKWWRRTRQRKSNLQPGNTCQTCLLCKMGHQSILDGACKDLKAFLTQTVCRVHICRVQVLLHYIWQWKWFFTSWYFKNFQKA